MVFNLRNVVLHTAYVQSFVVYRSSGQFVNGRWVENTPIQITMQGTVVAASEKEIIALPEGDRIQGSMVFHSTQELFPTRSNGTSDKILWNNQLWKLFTLGDYGDYGFWRMVGVRIKGN